LKIACYLEPVIEVYYIFGDAAAAGVGLDGSVLLEVFY